MAERAKFKGVINLIIKDGDKTLLFFRNDGFFSYGGGWWVMPAGHIEQGETALVAAIREAKEELDIDILPEDIEFSHIISNLASKTESFDFFFTVNKFSGTIRNCEGDLSLAYWQKVHKEFFTNYYKNFAPETKLVCEEFFLLK